MNCDTCPFRQGRLCKHPKNNYSWVKVGSRWVRAVHTLSNRFYPKPPAWCKRKETK